MVEMDVRLPVGYEKDEEAFQDDPFRILELGNGK
jgi:hypothetical protein